MNRSRLIAAVFVLAFVLAEQIGVFAAFNAGVGDVLMRAHVERRIPPADIVLIDIDQASLDHPQMLELAGNWPWPRAIHGELLEFLGSHEPAAIAFDVIFSEPDVFRPASDALFSEAVRRHEAILPIILASDGIPSPLRDLPQVMDVRPGPQAQLQAALPLIAPKAVAPDAWRTGLINFLPDSDRIGRRYWVRYPHAGWSLPSLPARTAAQARWPVPSEESIRLHWYGRPFQHISYSDVFLAAQSAQGKAPADFVGKVILIGATAPGLNDFSPTPLGATTSGVEILATALANMKADDWLRPVPPVANMALGAIGLLLVVLFFGRRSSPWTIAAALVGASLVVIALAYRLLEHNLQWTPFSPLLVTWVGFAGAGVQSYLRERRKRDHAVQMFSRFLDANVVRALVDGNALAKAEIGAEREITVLFSDIRGFTTLSEQRTPEEIVSLLNAYFDIEVAEVFAQGGTLDKFIGDAIMAFWNAPASQPDHAVRAVRAALGMSRAFDRFRESLGDPDDRFDIGIGVHTGPAVVGFLGASSRLDYTAIGDTVNLGSRIEGQTKGIARVLVSDATRQACGDIFEFIDHGEFTVKGRTQSVRLFEPKERT